MGGLCLRFYRKGTILLKTHPFGGEGGGSKISGTILGVPKP